MAIDDITTSASNSAQHDRTERDEFIEVIRGLDARQIQEMLKFAEYTVSEEGKNSTIEEIEAKGQSMFEEYKASLAMEQIAA